MHRSPNNAQNTQHKLGVAFSYLERSYHCVCDVSWSLLFSMCIMNIAVLDVYGFQTCFGSAASAFENIELADIHCALKKNFSVWDDAKCFPKSWPTEMKPSKCLAIETTRKEKVRKRGEGKAKGKSRDWCVTSIKIGLLLMRIVLFYVTSVLKSLLTQKGPVQWRVKNIEDIKQVFQTKPKRETFSFCACLNFGQFLAYILHSYSFVGNN